MTDDTAVVCELWAALYDRDWDRIAACFGPDSVYWDVPTGPARRRKARPTSCRG